MEFALSLHPRQSLLGCSYSPLELHGLYGIEDFFKERAGLVSAGNKVPAGDQRWRNERCIGKFDLLGAQELMVVEQAVRAQAVHAVKLHFVLDGGTRQKALESCHAHIFHILERHVVFYTDDRRIGLGI